MKSVHSNEEERTNKQKLITLSRVAVIMIIFASAYSCLCVIIIQLAFLRTIETPNYQPLFLILSL